MAYVPPLNGGRINASIGGNTAGAGALVSTGTLTLAGGNNITLSQNANAITISAANAAAASVNFSAGTTSNNLAAVTLSNTNGINFGLNGSTITASAAFSNTNGVSFGLSGGSVITASHNALTSQSNQAISAANGSSTFQTLSLANSNGVSFSTGTQGVFATVATNYLTTARASNDAIGLNTAQTNVTWTVNSSGLSLNAAGYAGTGFSGTNASGTLNSNGLQLSVGAGGGAGVALANSQTTYTSGTANLIEGGGAITIASTTGQSFKISVPATSSFAATGALSVSTNGSTVSMGVPNAAVSGANGSSTFQTLSFANSNGVSWSTGTQGLYATVATNYLTTARASNDAIGLNTAQTNVTWTVNSSGLSLNAAGYAGTGFSGTNATATLNSNGLQLSVAAGGGGGGIALYDGAHSISSGTASLQNGGGVNFSITGQTLSANVTEQLNILNNTTGGGSSTATLNLTNLNLSNYGAMSAGISGNTVQLSVPATSSLSATGGVSLSTNGSTISIGATAMPTLSRWEYPEDIFGALSTPVNGSVSVQHMYIPFNLIGSAAKIGASVSAASTSTASTGSLNLSLWMGLYTLNGSTLNLATSASTLNAISWQASATSQMTGILGMRQFTVPLSVNVTPGEYWMAAMVSSTFSAPGATMTLFGDNQLPTTAGGGILSPLGTNTSAGRDVVLFEGLYNTTTNALPSSMQGTQINNTAASNVWRANFYNAMFNATY